MRLEEKIMPDLKEAMKAKDQAALRAIRAIKAAILLNKTEAGAMELDEDGEIKMLQKLVKQRQESYDIYLKQGREDLATPEKEEIDIIMQYLPKQLTEDELTPIVQEIIQSTGAQDMKDMGKVMGIANKKLAGKADGKTLAGVIKKLLA